MVCAVAGEVAWKFVGNYRDGDIVVASGVHEPRPSTAALNTSWNGRFRVRTVCAASRIELAMEPIGSVPWALEATEPETEPALAQVASPWKGGPAGLQTRLGRRLPICWPFLPRTGPASIV